MNERIRNLIQIDRLAEEPASDDEVAGTWANAVKAFNDAGIGTMSLDGRVVRVFDAGRTAAHAIVRAHNYRVRARNHHETTIAVAGILGGEQLEQELQRFEAIRALRTQVEYGWQPVMDEHELQKAIENVRRILKDAIPVVRDQRPSISTRINMPT